MTDAGVAFVSLVPSMRGFSAAVSRELGTSLDGPSREAGRSSGQSFLAGFGSSLQSGGRQISGLGDKLTLGLSVPLALLGNQATNMASDTNEALSKVETVFGRHGAAIDAFATNAAQNFGLSRRSALDAAGGFGNMFTQMGIGQDVAASMSQSMLGLSSDFASFHNADITQVIEAQSAAFRGEFDALQRFVPMINAATVEQKALQQTGKESTSELTQQEKALATYTLMIEGAGAAAGDFARTQDSLANQERIAAAEADNAAAAFGQNLIPIKKQVIEVASQLLERFNNLTPAQQQMIVKAGLLAVALGPVLSVFGRLVTGIGSVVKASTMLGRGIATMARGGVRLAQLGARGAVALGRLAAAATRAGLAVLRAGVQMTIAAARATARVVASIATQIARWVVLGVQALLHAAKVALAWIISLGPIGLVIAAVIGLVALIIANWDKIVAFTKGAFQRVADAIGAAIDWVRNNWPLILAIITGPIGLAVLAIARNWDRIKAGIRAVRDFIAARIGEVVANFRARFERIKAIVATAWAALQAGITRAKNWVRTQVSNIVSFFRRLPGRLRSAISTLANALSSPFRNAFSAIKRLWNRTVGGFGFTVPDWVPGVGGKGFSIPRMHGGGIFEAATGQEGLALLQSGEGVFTRDQMAALGAGLNARAQPAQLIITTEGQDEFVRWVRKTIRTKGLDLSDRRRP